MAAMTSPYEMVSAGAPGVFSGVLSSENGLYSIAVTNDGITLNGPVQTLRITGSEICTQVPLSRCGGGL